MQSHVCVVQVLWNNSLGSRSGDTCKFGVGHKHISETSSRIKGFYGTYVAKIVC